MNFANFAFLSAECLTFYYIANSWCPTMRILYIAGFFTPTLDKVRVAAARFVEEGSLVLIEQRSDRQLDINTLKSSLFDKLTNGCEHVRICTFVFRKQEHVLLAVRGIVEAARARFPRATIQLKPFSNAQDADGLIKEVVDFAPSTERSFPQSLDELQEWLSIHLSNTIILHPRALRGAKESQYSDTSKIYAALSLLGREYWTMRTARPADSTRASGTFSNKLLDLGLELSPSISPTRAGEQGEDYTVSYPIGSLSKRTLDLHLKLGSDRDERWCLRIYFFWDGELRRVVVGWLPSHLGTRGS
jgi:hypothetical protein